MTRGGRIAAIAGATALFIVAALVLTGWVMVRSGWLEQRVRQRLIAEAESATGGKVEFRAIHFDWRSLTASLDDVTVHGREGRGAAPLLYLKRVAVGLRVISLVKRQFDIASVIVDSPRAHIIVEADGSTNLPEPKTQRAGKTVPETILDLKIGRFNLTNGLFLLQRGGQNSGPLPWSGSGQNLTAQVTYSGRAAEYAGQVSVAPLDFAWNGIRTRAQIEARISMQKNRLSIAAANVRTGQSRFEFSEVSVLGFTAPVTTGKYQASVSLADADRVFHLVNFEHRGTIDISGDLRFVSPGDYQINGLMRGQGIGYGKVRNVRVSGRILAVPGRVDLRSLVVNALGGEVRADGEIRGNDRFHLAGRMERFDAAALAGLADAPPLPYDAVLSGPFDASGQLAERDLHNLIAGATLDLAPAAAGIPAHGQITAKFTGSTNTIELGNSWIALPSTRLDVSGMLGSKLDIRFESHDLNDLKPVLNPAALPAALEVGRGSITFEGSVAGPVLSDRDSLRVTGRGAVQNAVYRGQPVDSLSGNIDLARSQLVVADGALRSGAMQVRLSGTLGLSDWAAGNESSVNATVQLNNGNIPELVALTGQKSLPVNGSINTTARIGGTFADPHLAADVTLSKGQIYGEPYDSVTGHAEYAAGRPQTFTAVLNAGRKRVTASGSFTDSGKVTFNVATNSMSIEDIALAREKEPGLKGMTQIQADGTIRLGQGKQFGIDNLNADINARGLVLDSRTLGAAHIAAATNNGTLTFRLDTDIAKSAIQGRGSVQLTGDYPAEAHLSFSKLGLAPAVALARGSGNTGADLNLDGSAAGEVTIRGPAMKPRQMTATIDVSQIELRPVRVSGNARNIPDLALRNSQPVRATFQNSTLRIDNARFTAPSTDLTLGGSIAFDSRTPFNLRVQGAVNLALAETFNSDLTSAGELMINASVLGSLMNPEFSGRAELSRGDFHLASFSNGLTSASGIILFSGTRATIQSFSAESGGGKVDVSGFGALTGGIGTFRVEAKTSGVRIRYPEGVSTVSDSDLILAGTAERSQASGTVTVRRVSINPKSDISTILAGAAQPLTTPQASSDFLSNMHLDVQVETAPDVAFETSVAQSIEADASLRLRGTAATPAVLGRINITQGNLTFFGNKYTINQGSVSFFNPARIDPILNVDLETKARGVDVVLTVTGPLNKLNMSYRSDPPLQFSDIVALLATGRTPSDPTLAVRDTGQPQSLQQIGASALIGQAIANPVAGRLQRFFGVSRIKIDPQLTGITGSPEARLTVEQQVTPDLLFTYITDVSSTSTQLIRVEWDFNRSWAAILTREENGYVGVDFAFRKRFK